MDDKNKNTVAENNQAASLMSNAQKTLAEKPIVLEREFEIAVYDVSIDDNTGKEMLKAVPFERQLTITATSPAELQMKLLMYKDTGQVAKVIKEVTDPKLVEAYKQLIALKMKKSVSEPISAVQQQEKEATNLPSAAVLTPSSTILQLSVPTLAQAPRPIRYYTVGGIDIKDDNGKLYQKQWIKLSEKEMENLRIVNTANNKIVSLNGKHIEMKKWTLVLDTEDTTTDLEENL